MFKKGSFEIGGTIYPVAIKVIQSSPGVLSSHISVVFWLIHFTSLFQYDPKFGDAFWNSSKYSMVSYLLRMMTSWALVCNVWYLPPMHQKVWQTENECPTICMLKKKKKNTHVCVDSTNVRREKMQSSLQTEWNPPSLIGEGWWICNGNPSNCFQSDYFSFIDQIKKKLLSLWLHLQGWRAEEGEGEGVL